MSDPVETVAMMRQTAPFPTILAGLVERVTYRPGWAVALVDRRRDDDHGRGEAGGLTLVIATCGYDSYHPDRGQTYRVQHFFVVPAATYDERSWRRWLFDQFLKVESHETCEFFTVDGERPYAPNHGPGCDPYTIVEYATGDERRMSFRGVLNDG